jgi:hypothetical protein
MAMAKVVAKCDGVQFVCSCPAIDGSVYAQRHVLVCLSACMYVFIYVYVYIHKHIHTYMDSAML